MSALHRLCLPSRFDFSYHTMFTQQYEAIMKECDGGRIELDFSQVQYLDSSALGMLVLLAKKNAAGKGSEIVICGAHGAANDELSFGRGISLVKKLTTSFDVIPPGNQVQVVISEAAQ